MEVRNCIYAVRSTKELIDSDELSVVGGWRFGEKDVRGSRLAVVAGFVTGTDWVRGNHRLFGLIQYRWQEAGE